MTGYEWAIAYMAGVLTGLTLKEIFVLLLEDSPELTKFLEKYYYIIIR